MDKGTVARNRSICSRRYNLVLMKHTAAGLDDTTVQCGKHMGLVGGRS